MGKSKQSPPDTPGNVRGRIAALKCLARMQARTMDTDYKIALKKRMSSLAPEFKKLRARLGKVAVKGPTPTPKKGNSKALAAPKNVEIAPGSDLMIQLLRL